MAFKDMHHRIRLLEDQCYALTKENDDLRAENERLLASLELVMEHDSNLIDFLRRARLAELEGAVKVAAGE